MNRMRRMWLRAAVWGDAQLKRIAVKLVRLTGKSAVALHPKHLVHTGAHHWYAMHVEPLDAVLDVGCGCASHATWLARQARLVVACDRDMAALKNGGRLTAGEGDGRTELLAADALQRWPFKDATFDKVLLLDVLEHLDRRVGVLREAARVLREDGLVLISVPNRDTGWKRRLKSADLPYFADRDHKVEYTVDQIRDELEAGGLEVVAEPQPIAFDTPLAGAIDAVGGISLSAYRRLQHWKVSKVLAAPSETTGWRVICRKGCR